MTEQIIIKTGILEKRSKYLKNWKQRYIVLTSHSILSYVDRLPSADCTMDLELSDCSDFKKEDNTLSFMNDGKEYLLKSENADEISEWFKAITDTIAKLPKIIPEEE